MSGLVGVLREPARATSSEVNLKAECCQHYWVIETPNGSVSRGVCKFCKEERHFNNSAERYVIRKRGSQGQL